MGRAVRSGWRGEACEGREERELPPAEPTHTKHTCGKSAIRASPKSRPKGMLYVGIGAGVVVVVVVVLFAMAAGCG